MSSPIRVGILGAGAFASRRHLPDLTQDPRASVVAACRRDPAALAVFADHFQIPQRFPDWQEMLDEAPLDALLIATPHDQHFPQARAALERGLHVLLEKPMALTGAEAETLAAQAQDSKKVLAVTFNPPYWRHAHALRDGIAAGRIGALESVDIRAIGNADAVFGKAPMPDKMPGVVRPTLFRADPAANGGGHLMDGGGHLLSELLWVTGRRPLEVSALMDQAPGDMRATLSVRLEGGVLATITAIADSRSPARRARSTYDGAAGSAVAEAMPFRVTWQGDLPETVTEDQMPPVPSPVSDWLDAILLGKTPLGDPAHGALVTRLLEAAYQSAQAGRAVSL